jgi:DNA-binding Lrp family transcriptional regulator
VKVRAGVVIGKSGLSTEGGSVKAYVLIQTTSDRKPLADWLLAIPEVASAESLTGAFDAIAIVQPRSIRHLHDGVLEQIRELPGVTRALPLPLIPHAASGATTEESSIGTGPRDEAA